MQNETFTVLIPRERSLLNRHESLRIALFESAEGMSTVNVPLDTCCEPPKLCTLQQRPPPVALVPVTPPLRTVEL